MKKSRFFIQLFLVIPILCLLTFGVIAQGRRGGWGGGGYGNSGGRFNSPRNYVTINNNYRGYNSNRFFYGQHYSYYPSYQYRSAYQSPFVYSHFGPVFGFRINVLPFGYSPFFIGNNPYYYYQGVYYSPYDNGGYQVVAPPLGAVIKNLPQGTTVKIINGEKYYELGGTFYEEEMSAKNKLQYRVVGTNGVINTVEHAGEQNSNNTDINNGNDYAPSATTPSDVQIKQQRQILNQLPANSKVVLINKQKLYLAPNGVYYQEKIDADNKLTYEIVGGE